MSQVSQSRHIAKKKGIHLTRMKDKFQEQYSDLITTISNRFQNRIFIYLGFVQNLIDLIIPKTTMMKKLMMLMVVAKRSIAMPSNAVQSSNVPEHSKVASNSIHLEEKILAERERGERREKLLCLYTYAHIVIGCCSMDFLSRASLLKTERERERHTQRNLDSVGLEVWSSRRKAW